MKKLKAVVQYECVTSFRYIWYFYAIQYAIVALIMLLVSLLAQDENVGVNALEFNTLVYVGILGVLGFQEDFKMLIQNGFPRKYIFAATFSLFAFISGITALVDTVVGNLLHHLLPHYGSMFGMLYGYGHLVLNWLWLFLLYLLVCSLLYLVVLVVHKISKTATICLGIGLGGLLLLVLAVARFILSDAAQQSILSALTHAMGFVSAGQTVLAYPLLTFFLLGAVFGLGAYYIIRRIELKS